MPTASGIFVLGELTGAVAEQVQAIVTKHDPKLARLRQPHVTLAGSSGMGPIFSTTSLETLRAALEPVAAATPPLELVLKPAHRFMTTDIIVLPIDPHGPIRVLHDRIVTSGLRSQRPRFTFSPHVTLNLYRTLTPEALRELMQVHITESVMVNRLQVYLTSEPSPARLLLELPLTGASAN